MTNTNPTTRERNPLDILVDAELTLMDEMHASITRYLVALKPAIANATPEEMEEIKTARAALRNLRDAVARFADEVAG